MSNPNRVQAGVPTAGQFASRTQAEPDFTLTPCAVREPEISTEPAFRATAADYQALAGHREPVADAFASRGLDPAVLDEKARRTDADIRALQSRLPRRRKRWLPWAS